MKELVGQNNKAGTLQRNCYGKLETLGLYENLRGQSREAGTL